MSRRYFISHSSKDKRLALPLADLLRPNWVDLYEIDVGELLLEEISAGIEQCTDFVLLWSKHSAQSRWVRFEFHMAFIRWMEDNAIRIRIVAVDDSDVPLYFRPFLQLRRAAGADEIATRLLGDAPRVPKTRSFVNRSREIGQIESAYYSAETSAMWVWGIQGVGKSSTCRAACERILPDASQFRQVTIRAGTSHVELNLLVSAALGTEPSPEGLTTDEIREDTRKLLGDFVRSGGVWVFDGAQHWLRDDATAGPVLADVLRAIGTPAPQAACLFTSTRKLHQPPRDMALLQLNGLEPDFGAALLRARGLEGDFDRLASVSRALDGHPLALELTASSPATEPDDHRLSVAAQIVGALELTAGTRRLLEIIAVVDGPLDGQSLSEFTGLSDLEFQAAVSEGSSYGLVGETERGFLRSHELVRDFFVRSFRKLDVDDQRLGDLADASVAHLRSLAPGTRSYIDSLTTSFRLLALSMRLEEAFGLRRDLSGVLFEAAVELYQDRKYREALRYFEQIVDRVSDNPEPQLYRARCLAYLRDFDAARNIISDLLDRESRSAASIEQQRVLRVAGRVEYIAERWHAAVEYYERALSSGRQYPPLLVDLAQAKIRLNDWQGARAAAEAAISSSRGTPTAFALNVQSQVLEHFGDLPAAKEAITAALLQDPTNAGYHHRLGRIAELDGDLSTARVQYEECLAIDPSFVESLISLASLNADEGDYTAAKRSLAKVRKIQGVRPAVVENVAAKISLADGDLKQARVTSRRPSARHAMRQTWVLPGELSWRSSTPDSRTCRRLGRRSASSPSSSHHWVSCRKPTRSGRALASLRKTEGFSNPTASPAAETPCRSPFRALDLLTSG